MGLRKIICDTTKEYTSLKGEFDKLSKNEQYAKNLKKSYGNNFIELASTCKRRNKKFDINILIIEDDLGGSILNYMQKFSEIDDSVNILACSKTNALKITLKDLIKDLSQIKLVIFDYDLDEVSKSKTSSNNKIILEADFALRRYNFIKEKLQDHQYTFLGLTAYKGFKSTNEHSQYQFLEEHILRGNGVSLDKLDLGNNYDLLESFYYKAFKSHVPNKYSSMNEVEYEALTIKKINKGKKFLFNLENGIKKMLEEHLYLNELVNFEDDKIEDYKKYFKKNLHLYVKTVVKNKKDKTRDYYGSSLSLEDAINRNKKIIKYIITNKNTSSGKFKNIKYAVTALEYRSSIDWGFK